MEIIKRSWKSTAPEEVRRELESKDWDKVYREEDPVLAYRSSEQTCP